MISRSKLAAIDFIAAMGVASAITAGGVTTPAFAQYSPSQTGGGSTGYNIRASTPNYRLKHHSHAHHSAHQPSKPQ